MTLDLLDQNNDQRSELDYFSEVAGPGKKFDLTKYENEDAWKQAISKKAIAADDHIRQLEEDNRRLREYNTSRASLEQLVDKLTNEQSTSSDSTLNAKEPEQPQFDPRQIDELVSNRFNQLTAAQKQEANVKNVSEELTKHYGPNFRAVLKQHVDELGLDASYVNDIVRNQPKILYRLLGLDGTNQKQPETFQAPVRNQQNTSFVPSGGNKRTWAYYQNMRKTDPKTFNDPSTHSQMLKDAEELGDAFADGNWENYRLRQLD